MSGIEAYVNKGLRRRLLQGDEPEWLKRHRRREYIIACVLSAPPWMPRRAFKKLREEANLQTQITGVRHVLGHIVPVTHPLVCGLTVPWNIHIIDAMRNARDSNKLHEAFQIRMFESTEQFLLI